MFYFYCKTEKPLVSQGLLVIEALTKRGPGLLQKQRPNQLF